MATAAAALPAGRVFFVIPPGRPPSGGDLYNRFLLDALAGEGVAALRGTPEDARRLGPRLPRELWVDSLYLDALEGPLAPLRAGRDVFVIVHRLPSLDPGLRPSEARGRRAAEDRLFASVRGFLAPGPPVRDALAARGLDGRPVFLVPPAPCVRPARPSRPAPGVAALIVSSLQRAKGVPDYLEALGATMTRTDALTLRIAGRADIDPACAAACLRRIEARPALARAATYLGVLSLARLRREYERCSVFVSPSPWESFGMAFHEARLFRRPILAVRAPYSTPYVVPGHTGRLADSPAALARTTLDLVRRPERLREMAEEARLRPVSDGYTWTRAARAFLEQYRAWAAPGGLA